MTEAELSGQGECGHALRYVDRVLAKSAALYEDSVVELYQRDSIAFTDRVHAEKGLFFVIKKSGQLRFIFDARRCNDMFRQPPSGDCCTAAAFANLRVPKSSKLFSAAYELMDFFCRLRIRRALGLYFGMPPINIKRVAARVGAEAFDGIPASCERAFSFLTVLPMGIHGRLTMPRLLYDFVSRRLLAPCHS